ncbi:hypothetical protein [Nocardia caishijiensis]|uniref:Uncharacterized protein n=1 Tax=Nocardia caishijiensis TaxID=184756 RepID=A0ABQ6YRM8_9NOCA|nr:hypothetical protein [Nocardia caishijiensis]KAF0848409.1 hypothetical protein FNL39_102558 [Nocardia caishijiensis]
MSFTKLVTAGITALAFGAVLTAGPATAAPVAPVVAPGEPAPGGVASGSAIIDDVAELFRQLQCGSAYSCGAPA